MSDQPNGTCGRLAVSLGGRRAGQLFGTARESGQRGEVIAPLHSWLSRGVQQCVDGWLAQGSDVRGCRSQLFSSQ